MFKPGVITLAVALALVAPTAGASDILLGLKQQELVSLVGAPSLKRRENKAQLWQYAHDRCVLQVFLFDDSGLDRVTHVEARMKGRAQTLMTTDQVTPCLEAMGIVTPQQTVEDVDVTAEE